MKRLFAAFILLTLFPTQTTHAQHTITDLAGSWVSADGTTGNIEFLDGGKVQGNIGGLQLPPTPYTIDFGRTPAWFDVTVMAGKTVKGLLEFIDDDTVKWQIFLTTDFSYDFTESDANPTIILKRKKN